MPDVGTVVITESRGSKIDKVLFSWTSDSSGNATKTTIYDYTGEIISVVQVPSAGGTTPTTLYDVVATDNDAVDVLAGLGANLSIAANTLKAVKDGLGAVYKTQIALSVSNAGAAKLGKTIIYIRK